MALVEQNIPLAFGQGVDTKTDPKAVTAKLLRLENAVFTQGHQINKRNGYDPITTSIAGGTNLVNPKMIATFKDQLICQDQGNIYSYSPLVNSWQPQVGAYTSCKSENLEISSGTLGQYLQDGCVWQPTGFSGNLEAFVWTQLESFDPKTTINPIASLTTSSRLSVRDPSTGAVLLNAKAVPNGSASATFAWFAATKVAAMSGGANLATVVAGFQASNSLLFFTPYAVSNGQVVAGTRVELTGGTFAANVTPVFPTFANITAPPYPFGGPSTLITSIGQTGVFDFVPTSAGGVVAYGWGVSIVVKSLTNSGTVLHTNMSLSASSYIRGISLCVGPDGNVWIYALEANYTTSGMNKISYGILSADLTTVILPMTVIIPDVGVPANAPATTQFTVIANTNTQQTFFYSSLPAPYGAGTRVYANIVTQYATVSSTGTIGTLSPLSPGLEVCSKPYIDAVTNQTYVAALYRSPTQGTVFLLDVYGSGQFTGAAVAKTFENNAFSFFANYQNDPIFFGQTNAPYWSINPFGFAPSPITLASGKTGFLFPKVIVDNTSTGAFPVDGQNVPTITQNTISVLASFDFANPELYQSIEAGNLLVMGGGILWQYDGACATELGFNLYPEIVIGATTGSGSGHGNGVYEYAALYEWVDNQGQLHQSSPSYINVTVTGNHTVNLTVLTPNLTIKNTPNIPQVVLYRSAAGTSFLTRLASTPLSSAGHITFSDSYNDSAIASNDALYTNGGVLENIAPPPGLTFTSFNNRVWTIDTTNPNTVWYSKSLQPGVGMSFSDLLVEQVNAIGGDCIALAGMDSNLVIFEERQPLIIQGDGANDAGLNSTLTPAQPIPSDAGISTSKGLMVYPGGIIRKTPKGIYLLGRSLQDQYFGFDVEKYNSQDIVATTLLPDKTQIRFLTGTAGGLTLVYDYFFNQWSTFTQHTGVSATVWNGAYTYLWNSNPSVPSSLSYPVSESTGYADSLSGAYAPFSVLIQTGWLALSSIQNFERVKKLLLLGRFQGAAGHGIQVAFSYDFEGNSAGIFNNSISPYLFLTTNDTYQLRTFLPKQKCDSVSIKITEITSPFVFPATPYSGNFLSITDMSFEAAIKKGLNKKSAADTVG